MMDNSGESPHYEGAPFTGFDRVPPVPLDGEPSFGREGEGGAEEDYVDIVAPPDAGEEQPDTEAANPGEASGRPRVTERVEDRPVAPEVGDTAALVETSRVSDADVARRVGEIVNQVYELDPEIVDREDTRPLVELGARVGIEVTKEFGTPDNPKIRSGTHEKDVLMSYHNGGDDGHTSVGELGAGVPRNVLVIAKGVNQAAGAEIYTPSRRALAFFVAEAHDRIQLCGRALLPEGQGDDDKGDERLTAEWARNTLLQDGHSPGTAEKGYDLAITTAWNPELSTQNVNYDRITANPHDPQALEQILDRELIAGGDLFSPTTPRGPLGTIEYAVERIFLVQNGQAAQQRFAELGIDPATIGSMEQMMEVVSSDDVLTGLFTNTLDGDPVFYADYLKYSDRYIRQVCGKGIDDLSPNRVANAATLSLHVSRLRANETPETPIMIWRRARHDAGY